jgi:hypothetical protein
MRPKNEWDQNKRRCKTLCRSGITSNIFSSYPEMELQEISADIQIKPKKKKEEEEKKRFPDSNRICAKDLQGSKPGLRDSPK